MPYFENPGEPMLELIVKPTAAQVAERWKQQYFRRGQWGDCMGGTARSIHDALLALGRTRSERKIAAVIGNETWTRIECDGCGSFVDRACKIGDEDNYRTFKLCTDCIKAMSKAIRA